MSLNKENIIVEHFLNRYKDIQAIILHGSRAKQNHSKHSDWDIFIIVTNYQKQKEYRTIISKEHIDYEILDIKDTKSKLPNWIYPFLQEAKVIHQTNNFGDKLLKSAKTKKINKLNQIEYNNKKLHIENLLNGLKDNINNPPIYCKKFSQFYLAILNNYFQIKLNTYSKDIRSSLAYLQKTDLNFYNLFIKLSDTTSRKEKLEISKRLYELIFKQPN